MAQNPPDSNPSAPVSQAGYQGFYINLDRSPERNEAMQRQLTALSLAERYKRFAAIDGLTIGAPRMPILPGEYGCFLSHANALKLANQESCVHVLEDDALLSPFVAPVIDSLAAKGYFDQYDIIFTDIAVQRHLAQIRFFRQLFDKFVSERLFSVVDLSRIQFGCNTSYIVGGKSIGKLQELYAREIAATPGGAVDIFIRNNVNNGVLRAAVTIPFLTSVRMDSHIDHSTITGRPIDRVSQIANVLNRQSFFVNRDLAEMARLLSTLSNRPVTSADVLDRLAEFVTSQDRQDY